MGNNTTKAVGTDFEQNRRNRERDNDADNLPTIPYVKQKKVDEELGNAIKTSIFFANYKRAFRGYLRTEPERSQMGTQLRIHFNALSDAERLGLPKDRYEPLIDEVVAKMLPELQDDIIEFLEERQKISKSDDAAKKARAVEHSLSTIFQYLGDDVIEKTGKKLYEKYSRGADFETSDVEVDKEKLARLQAQKEARLKEAAAERQRQAEAWAKEAEEEESRQRQRQDAIAQRQAEQKAIEAAAAGGGDGGAAAGGNELL